MKTYDKAAWHIDGGEKKAEVAKRFREVFEFLDNAKMLNADGRETLKYGMDDSASLNSTMVTKEGNDFLAEYYDEVLSRNPRMIRKNLEKAYKKYTEEDQ